jgi:hypothetical protein
MSRRGELLVELVGDFQDARPVPQPLDQVRREEGGAVRAASSVSISVGRGLLKEGVMALEASRPEACYLTTEARLKGAKRAEPCWRCRAMKPSMIFTLWAGTFAGTGGRWPKSPSS